MKQKELECIRKGVLNEREPSIVADLGTTSSCGRIDDLFIPTGIPSGLTHQWAKELQQQSKQNYYTG